MQKREYMVVQGFYGYGNNSLDVAKPRGWRLTDAGRELVTDFKARPKGTTEMDAVAQFIARLGDDGWEMVGAGTMTENSHCLYFKRPKP